MHLSPRSSLIFVVSFFVLSAWAGAMILGTPSAQARPLGVSVTLTPTRSRGTQIQAPQLTITSNITVSQLSCGSSDHREPWIAIDPLDSNHVLAASIYSACSYHAKSHISTNGGSSWAQVVPDTPGMYSSTDPIVAFDKSGNGYFVEKSSNPPPGGIFIFKNQGITWTVPFTLAQTGDADKPFVAVDHTSGANANRIYATWTTSSTIVMRYSDNFLSWSSPITVNPSYAPLTQWSNIAIGADGAVYVSYVNFAPSPQTLLVSKSTNGGVSFSNTYTIAASNPVSWTVSGYQSSWIKINSTLYTQVNNGPALATHPTDPNKLAVVWMEGYNSCVPVTGCLNGHIVASPSNDGGATWSTPVVVNDDADAGNRDHFFPALAASPTGVLHSSWYDRRQSVNPGNPYLYNEFYSYSLDWGQTWEPNVRVSTASSDPTSCVSICPFIGDYSGIAVAADNSVIMPIWTDARSGEQVVLTARIPSSPTSSLPFKNFFPIILK